MPESAGPPNDPPPETKRTANGGDESRRRGDLERVARDGSLKLAGSMLSDLLGFVFVMVATHGFGKASAGRFFAAMALALILSNVAKLGADMAFVRFIPRFRVSGRGRDLRPMLLVGIVPVAVLSTVLGVVAFFAGPQLAHLFGKANPARFAPYVRIMAVALPAMTVYAIALAASRGFGTIKPLVAVDNVLVPLGRTAVALAAAAAGLSGLWLGYATAGTMTVGMVVILAWTYRLLGRAERGGAKAANAYVAEEGGVAPVAQPRASTRALFAEYWRFAGPRGFASISATLNSNLNVLLLGAFVASGSIGVFAAASRFMKLGALALVAIFYVISPQISALLAKGDRARAQAVYQVSTWWVMLGSWPVYFVFAVWAPFLMKLFGKGFEQGGTVLTILSLGMLVSMAAGPVSIVLLMGGHAFWNLANTVVALSLNIGLNLWLIPKYGITGAAIATSVAIAVNNLAAVVEVAWLMRLGTLGVGFGIVAAASGLCFGGIGLAVRLTVGMTMPTFLAFAVVSSLLYLFVVLRFRDTLELQVLWDTVVLRGRKPKRYLGRHRPSAVATAMSEGAREGVGATAGFESELEAELEIDSENLQGPA